MLRQFVVAVLVSELTRLKRVQARAGRAQGIAVDVARMLRHRTQALLHGAPTNAQLLAVWDAAAARLSRVAEARSRPGSRSTSLRPGGRLWRQLSGLGRAGARLLSLSRSGGASAEAAGAATVEPGPAAGASASVGPEAAEPGEELLEPRLVMALGGELVDEGGLAWVLAAANEAAGSELSSPEVAAAAAAVMRRIGRWQAEGLPPPAPPLPSLETVPGAASGRGSWGLGWQESLRRSLQRKVSARRHGAPSAMLASSSDTGSSSGTAVEASTSSWGGWLSRSGSSIPLLAGHCQGQSQGPTLAAIPEAGSSSGNSSADSGRSSGSGGDGTGASTSGGEASAIATQRSGSVLRAWSRRDSRVAPLAESMEEQQEPGRAPLARQRAWQAELDRELAQAQAHLLRMRTAAAAGDNTGSKREARLVRNARGAAAARRWHPLSPADDAPSCLPLRSC